MHVATQFIGLREPSSSVVNCDTMKASEIEDYWQILGLEPGASTTDVQRAYRKKSLIVHPDRYKGDNPEWATAEFLRLTRAKEVLEDDKARAAFEALQKARAAHKEKREAQDEGRRKLREDLEAREEAARKRQYVDSASAETKAQAAREAAEQAHSESAARADLQKELERLRRTGRLGGQTQAAGATNSAEAAAASSAGGGGASAGAAAPTTSSAPRAKVSLRWDPAAPMSADTLQRLLVELGAPANIDLAVVDSRAVVEMSPAAAAALSARSVELAARGVRLRVQATTGGDAGGGASGGGASGGGGAAGGSGAAAALPLGWREQRTPDGKVYYYHVATRQTQWTLPTAGACGQPAAARPSAGGGGGQAFDDLESMTMMRLQQAAARQKRARTEDGGAAEA